MKYSLNEIAKFRKALKNAPITDWRVNYYNWLGDSHLLWNVFGEVDFDNDALNELKNYIANNDDIVMYLIRTFDSNYGIDFKRALKIELELLKSEDDFNYDSFVSIEVKVRINNEWFYDCLKFLWK